MELQSIKGGGLQVENMDKSLTKRTVVFAGIELFKRQFEVLNLISSYETQNLTLNDYHQSLSNFILEIIGHAESNTLASENLLEFTPVWNIDHQELLSLVLNFSDNLNELLNSDNIQINRVLDQQTQLKDLIIKNLENNPI